MAEAVNENWVLLKPNDSEDESIETISEEVTDDEIIMDPVITEDVSDTENVSDSENLIEEYYRTMNEPEETCNQQDEDEDFTPVEVIVVIVVFSSFFVPFILTSADFLNIDPLVDTPPDPALDKKYFQEHTEVLNEQLKLLTQVIADLKKITPDIIQSKSQEDDLINSWIKITSNIKTDIINLNKKISYFILKNSLNLKTDLSKICDENECKAKKTEILDIINNGIKNSIFSWIEFVGYTIETDLSKILNQVATGQKSLVNIIKRFPKKSQEPVKDKQGNFFKNNKKMARKVKRLNIKTFDYYYDKIIKKLKSGNFSNFNALKFHSINSENETTDSDIGDFDNYESYWFFNIAKHREDKRLEHSRGDWFFNRAVGRRMQANY